MDLVIIVSVVAIIMMVLSFFLVKRGKRWLLGGKILKTYEAEAETKRGIKARSKIKVHAVETRLPKARHVGIELRRMTGVGHQVVPATLSVHEAGQLADMLQEAIAFHKDAEADVKAESESDK